MKKDDEKLTHAEIADAKARRLTAMHLHEIEGNPLDAQQVAMFEMFEREGWSHERRIEHIRRLYSTDLANAAE